jgi:hypothetical protein
MTFARKNRGAEWFELYPVAEKLQCSSSSASDVLLVDVGGGHGQAITGFKDKNPTIKGSLIVQDLPVVVESMPNLPAGITAMPHNFFEPQPVIGAKAYYLRAVLHDWPDKQALIILKNIQEAMNEGSVLLINEVVLPESNVSIFTAQTDFLMMSMYSALERTKKQWEGLLREAGLELVAVWDSPDKVALASSLLECRIRKE